MTFIFNTLTLGPGDIEADIQFCETYLDCYKLFQQDSWVEPILEQSKVWTSEKLDQQT